MRIYKIQNFELYACWIIFDTKSRSSDAEACCNLYDGLTWGTANVVKNKEKGEVGCRGVHTNENYILSALKSVFIWKSFD